MANHPNRSQTWAVSTAGGEFTEPSIIARCAHQGDAERIAMLWAMFYGCEMVVRGPSGTKRVGPDGRFPDTISNADVLEQWTKRANEMSA